MTTHRRQRALKNPNSEFVGRLKKYSAKAKTLVKKVLLTLLLRRRRLQHTSYSRREPEVVYLKGRGTHLGTGMEGVVRQRQVSMIAPSGRKRDLTLVEKYFHERHYPAHPGRRATQSTTGNFHAQINLYAYIKRANQEKKLGIRIPTTFRYVKRFAETDYRENSIWMTPYDLLDYEKLDSAQRKQFNEDRMRQTEALRDELGVKCSVRATENFKPLLDSQTKKVVAILIDFGHMASPLSG